MSLLAGALWALVGCPHPTETEAAVEPVTPGHVKVATGLATDPATGQPTRPPSERERVMAVLLGSQVPASACYEQALLRDPHTYGELVVGMQVQADGRVASVWTDFVTVNDDALETCVLAVVGGLQFPPPKKDPTRVSWPYVFTSDLTPPEVVRALLLRHGLLEEGAERVPLDPREEVMGHGGWWSSW